MVPFVELVNRHSSRASALSYTHILLLFSYFGGSNFFLSACDGPG